MTLIFRSLIAMLLIASSVHAEHENIQLDREPTTEKLQQNQDLDTYIKGFCKSLGENEYIVYKKKTLLILPKYSTAITTFTGTVAVCGLTLGVATLPMGNRRINQVDSICATSFMIGCLFSGITAYRLWMQMEKEAYIILDSDGITVWGKKLLSWKQVSKVSCETSVSKDLYGHVIAQYKTMNFLDIYGNSLGKIIEGEELPITFQKLLTLIEQYLNTYGSRHNT